MALASGSKRRLLAIGAIALLLAPGVWLRSDPREWQRKGAGLAITPVPAERPADWPAGLDLQGVWQLTSANPLFGGYSALVVLPGGRLRAYSDRAAVAEFAVPDSGTDFARIAEAPRINFAPSGGRHGAQSDQESAQRDPATGDIWIGYESRNAIQRFPAGGAEPVWAIPREMRDWPINGGPEAMVRLPDGRFIVLGESASDYSTDPGPGLLFAGDPTEGAHAQSFRFRPEPGYQPTDMATLPDGRVLILLRKVELDVPPFHGALLIADPAAIRAGEPWPWTLLARLEEPLPQENYEGLAVVPAADGSLSIWLVSDDNGARLQRALLVKLRWSGWKPDQQTERESPAPRRRR